jgi:Ankyrin repeats (3 copies)
MRLSGNWPSATDRNAVLAAASFKSRAHLKWFAKKFKGIGSWSHPDGYGPFHAAAYSGDLDTMKLLVRLGANPKRLEQSGRSALHSFTAGFCISKEADVHGRLAENVVAYLVATCGLNPDQPVYPSGDTPLHTAAVFDGCADVARALIRQGATVDSRCAKGMVCYRLCNRKHCT